MRYLLIVAILLLSSTCFAYDKPIAAALENYLRDMNKFEGSSVSTKEEDGKWVITKWVVAGVSQPTEAELKDIVKDYSESAKEKNKKAAAQRLKSLGFTKGEIGAIMGDKYAL